MAITDKNIKSMVRILWDTVMGKDENRHDQGLVGDVEKNTAFRKSASKLLWIILVAIIGSTVSLLALGPGLIAAAIGGQ